MLRFFWPSKLNPNPNVLTRFGRVLHWITIVAFVPGLYWLGLGAYQYVTNDAYWYTPYGGGAPYLITNWPNSIGYGVGFSVVGIFVYLCGRALRYIFSGE